MTPRDDERRRVCNYVADNRGSTTEQIACGTGLSFTIADEACRELADQGVLTTAYKRVYSLSGRRP